MTLIVGVRCKNGVVMGADTTATFVDGGGNPSIRLDAVRKIRIIEKKMIFALTGSTAMAGRIAPVIQEVLEAKATLRHEVQAKVPPPRFDTMSRSQAMERIRLVLHERVYGIEQQAAGLARSAGNHAVANEAQSSFMLAVGFKAEDDFSLMVFNAVGLPEELTEDIFCTNIGSGQMIADPFMGFIRRVLWDDEVPTVEQATMAVVWCLDHAIKLNPGGVGGEPQVATLEFFRGGGWKSSLLPEDRMSEHRVKIEMLEKVLREAHTSGEKPAERTQSEVPA